MANVQHYLSDMQERRTRRRRYAALGIVLGFILVVALGSAWLFFWSPLLKFDRVLLVHGGKTIEDQALAGKLLSALRNRRFFPEDSFLGLLPALPPEPAEAMPPYIKTVGVRKRYREHILELDIKERDPFGIWCFGKADAFPSCAWFDGEGVLFEQALNAEGALVRTVRDYSRGPIALGQRVLPANFFENLRSVFDVLDRGGIHAREVVLSDIELQEVEVRTFDGPRILFSIRFPAENTLSVIRSLKEKADFGALGQLDFRVENRAYYR